MDIHTLQKRLEIWKNILFINLGASLVLFVQAVLTYQDEESLLFEASWYAVWLIVQLATFLPGFVLLWGKHWMKIPLHERLNTIFGYFAAAWFTLLPVGVSIASKSLDLFLLGFAVLIATCYEWLRRKSLGMQNEIFP